MTLTSIAPAERTENLVYLLFPTALAVAIAYHITRTVVGGEVIIEVAKWPSIIGIIAPLLGILLYEVALDEWGLKSFYRWKLRRGQAGLSWRLAIAHLYLKTWKNEIDRAPSISETDQKKDYITTQSAAQIENTVSSYYVRRRFWRIRASIYLLLSVPFFIYTFVNTAIDIKLLTANYLIQLPFIGTLDVKQLITWGALLLCVAILLGDYVPKRRFLTSWYYLLPLIFIGGFPILFILESSISRNLSIFLITLEIEVVIIYVHLRRNSHLFSHLRFLCQYYYWQLLVSMRSVVQPLEYENEPEKLMVRKELNSLQILLNRGDTSVFFPLWDNVQASILNDLYVNLPSFIKESMLQEWTTLLYLSRKKLDRKPAIRKLGWLVYYLHSSKVDLKDLEKMYDLSEDKTAEAIMNRLKTTYKQSRDFKGLSPVGTLSFMPGFLLTEDGEESVLARGISAALHILYNGSANDHVSNLAHIMVTQFSETSEVGLDASEVARFLVRYAKELYKMNKRDQQIFRGRDLDSFIPIFSLIEDSVDSKYLLIDFIRGTPSLDQLYEKHQNHLIQSDDNVWDEVITKATPREVKGGTTDKFLTLHYKRLFDKQDEEEREEERIRYIARAMWQYLEWKLGPKQKKIEDSISNRMKKLDEENQEILGEFWSRRNREPDRPDIITNLKEIAGDNGIQ